MERRAGGCRNLVPVARADRPWPAARAARYPTMIADPGVSRPRSGVVSVNDVSGKVRIISGQWRRRILRVPDVENLRPTPDRVRETLFNWLADSIEGARCLDLYAGSGALGFEAASRGAARVVLVERDERAVDSMCRLARELDASQIQVVHADVRRWLQREATVFDIVFVDPPYGSGDLGDVCALLEEGGWLASDALLYLESDLEAEALPLPPGWRMQRRQKAGRVRYHLAARG